MDSPLGRGLLRRSRGEQVLVELPAGALSLTIIDVQYGARPRI
jgi:transcription elongation GreA/GreB family factor